MANVILLQKGDLKSSDFTNDNSNNKEGIGVRVSEASGNLIQKRKDGLYYGIEAPPNLSNLYVDAVNGVDQHPDEVEGAGTRAKPLKTFKYANDISYEGTTRTIHLMADQDHIVNSYPNTVIKPGYLEVKPYGPVYDAYKLVHVSNPATLNAMRTDVKLPRLVLTGFHTYKWYGDTVTDVALFASISNNANTQFSGVHIVLDNQGSLEPTSANTTTLRAYQLARIVNGDTITFEQCDISSIGTTTTNQQFTHGIVSLYNKDTGIMNNFNKNFIGLLATPNRVEATTIFSRILYRSDNMTTSDRGWGVDYFGSISLRDASLPDNHVITDYIFTKSYDTLRSGDRIIINPSTDVPSSDWY